MRSATKFSKHMGSQLLRLANPAQPPPVPKPPRRDCAQSCEPACSTGAPSHVTNQKALQMTGLCRELAQYWLGPSPKRAILHSGDVSFERPSPPRITARRMIAADHFSSSNGNNQGDLVCYLPHGVIKKLLRSLLWSHEDPWFDRACKEIGGGTTPLPDS